MMIFRDEGSCRWSSFSDPDGEASDSGGELIVRRTGGLL